MNCKKDIFILSTYVLAIGLLAGCGQDLAQMSESKAKDMGTEAITIARDKDATPQDKQKEQKDVAALEKAAAKKNEYAAYYLGRYEMVAKDQNLAAQYLLQAAKAGYPKAEFLVGILSISGYGSIQKSEPGQVMWLTKAAKANEPHAALMLGSEYITGKGGVVKDPAKGFPLILQAANANIPVAEYMAYRFYSSGVDGAPQDPQKANYWMHKVETGKSPFAKIVEKQQEEKAIVQHMEATNSGPGSGSFTTDCNNMDCVRRYSNGAVIHFIACMNPADMEPMDNAPVIDGQGECSGTDAEGNFYGMGSLN